MVLTIDIINIGKSVKLFRNAERFVNKLPTQITLESAQVLHRLVKSNLAKRTSTQRSGHNTPSLQRDIFLRATSNGHRVAFRPNKVEPNLASMVEFGTSPHWQIKAFNKRVKKDHPWLFWHPGAKPKRFFQRAQDEFKRSYREEIVKKHADMAFSKLKIV
ncbi:hypothetical protein CMI37_29220 [Candidatus Pacearchaeota archaeon]|nr:hypothetical protein [Candidatus Pacearchaeota archaeon]|tara:strand:- start:7010 stop:7489 length:480 start_codon:yes stop_codon:yes gene_type:complete